MFHNVHNRNMAEAEVFVLSSTLVFALCRHEYAWQSFTILLGPPGGGKSESVNNVSAREHGAARRQQEPVCRQNPVHRAEGAYLARPERNAKIQRQCSRCV